MNFEKKEEFKKLFYTSLTETEIKELLKLNYKEYKDLLKAVKGELGLPSSYRRKPKRYWKYTKDSYYILKMSEDTFEEIICYCPTFEIAQDKLENMLLDEDYTYIIEQASDDNLVRLIYDEYYIKGNNWEGIMSKFKLPYHKFYSLLSTVKSELGVNNRTTRNDRFIYEYSPTKKFVIKKYISGKYVNYGYYDSKEIAIRVRDYLESIGWDYDLWLNNKSDVMEDIVK